MRTLFAAILVMIASAAHAGSISIQVVQTGQTTLTKTYTVPDADVGRIVSAYQVDANRSVNGAATRAQVLQYWAQQFIDETKAAVLSSEQNAAVLALPPITPINPQ